ncbi:MAG: hypothetical protein JK586_05760, partial [Nocardiopsis sp. BM-2018]
VADAAREAGIEARALGRSGGARVRIAHEHAPHGGTDHDIDELRAAFERTIAEALAV